MSENLICANCGASLEDADYYVVNNDYYCEYCYYDNFIECHHCGEVIPTDDAFYYEPNAEWYCQDCSDEFFTRCDHCGEFTPVDDAITDEYGTTLCQDCYDEYYTRCYNCDRIIHRDREAYWDDDAEEYFCEDCYNERRSIHSYNYKPRPIFFGSTQGNALYLGVELEVDKGGEDRYNAKEIIDIMDDFVYCKHDGSLDDGFEIVSHPATLHYHMYEASWKEALSRLVELGYKSHDAGTCGLHVHMSRRAFGETVEEQDLNILKLLYLFEKFWDYIVKFSRRTKAQISQWAARYGIVAPTNELLDTAKSAGRYHAINLQPQYTVEIRIFRGTLRYTTFIATLQFCQHLYDTVMRSSIEDLQRMTWNDFIKAVPQEYEELLNYLEEKSLLNVPEVEALAQETHDVTSTSAPEEESTSFDILYACPVCHGTATADEWDTATIEYIRNVEGRPVPRITHLSENIITSWFICPHCGERIGRSYIEPIITNLTRR